MDDGVVTVSVIAVGKRDRLAVCDTTAQRQSQVIKVSDGARAHRSLERRIGSARIGRFKALADFDWGWPKQCDRGAVEGLMAMDFIKEGANVVLRVPNGVGKSMLARNVAHQALVKGHTVRFTTAGELLGDLAALDSDAALQTYSSLRCTQPVWRATTHSA